MINKNRQILWSLLFLLFCTGCSDLFATPTTPAVSLQKAENDVLATVQSDIAQRATEPESTQEPEPITPEVTQIDDEIVQPTPTSLPTLPPASAAEISGGFNEKEGELPTLGDGTSQPSDLNQPDEALPADDVSDPANEPTPVVEPTAPVGEDPAPVIDPISTPTADLGEVESTPTPQLEEATATATPQPVELSPTVIPNPNQELPTVEEINGEIVVSIPDRPPLEQATYAVLRVGDGLVKNDADTATISYVMYGWNVNALVESTDEFGGPFEIELGEGYVPVALEQAIVGQPVGSRLLVVFPANMDDLPSYFDASDGYVLVVDIVD